MSDYVSSSPINILATEYGSIQFWRNGDTGELYYPYEATDSYSAWYLFNSVSLRVGNILISTYNGAIGLRTTDYWSNTLSTVSTVTGSGTSADPWQITVNLVPSFYTGYSLQVVYSYINGEDYIDISTTPTVPATNTNLVKVYHLMDSYLDGSDEGPGFALGSAPYNAIGVQSNFDGDVIAFSQRGLAWDHYDSGSYWDVLNAPYYYGDLSNTIDTDPLTDNAIGVQWTLGYVAGTQPTIEYRIGFSDYIDNVMSSCGIVKSNRQISRTVNN